MSAGSSIRWAATCSIVRPDASVAFMSTPSARILSSAATSSGKAARMLVIWSLHARSDGLRTPLVMDADASFVRFAASEGQSRIPWSEVVRWREDGSVVLLYHSPILFNIVPKRVLPAGGLDALRDLYETGGAPRRRWKPAKQRSACRDRLSAPGSLRCWPGASPGR